ncbi:hypothetical protein HY992_00350 [Candidatus Micrarchaeota archaeon]|nr:hypothetical protein [Candidatus Micrarchaeota archaeon]
MSSHAQRPAATTGVSLSTARASFERFSLSVEGNARVSALVARKIDDALKAAVGSVVKRDAGRSVYQLAVSRKSPKDFAESLTRATFENMQDCERRASVLLKQKLVDCIRKDFSIEFAPFFEAAFLERFQFDSLASLAVQDMLKNGSSKGEWSAWFSSAVKDSVDSLVADAELSLIVSNSLVSSVDASEFVRELRVLFTARASELANGFSSEFSQLVLKAVFDAAFEILQGISASKVASGFADALIEGQHNNTVAEQKAREVVDALNLSEFSVETAKLAFFEAFRAIQAESEVAEQQRAFTSQPRVIELTDRVSPGRAVAHSGRVSALLPDAVGSLSASDDEAHSPLGVSSVGVDFHNLGPAEEPAVPIAVAREQLEEAKTALFRKIDEVVLRVANESRGLIAVISSLKQQRVSGSSFAERATGALSNALDSIARELLASSEFALFKSRAESAGTNAAYLASEITEKLKGRIGQELTITAGRQTNSYTYLITQNPSVNSALERVEKQFESALGARES